MKLKTAVLDNIRSAHNVGSIFRTADGCGIEKLILVGITPEPFVEKKHIYMTRAHKDIAKTALSAEQSVVWEYVATMNEAFEKLRKEDYEIVALEQSANSIGYDVYQSKKEKIALVIGNETEGIDEDILERCDAIVEIPMRGIKNSLNVSVAFGIASFELNR